MEFPWSWHKQRNEVQRLSLLQELPDDVSPKRNKPRKEEDTWYETGDSWHGRQKESPTDSKGDSRTTGLKSNLAGARGWVSWKGYHQNTKTNLIEHTEIKLWFNIWGWIKRQEHRMLSRWKNKVITNILSINYTYYKKHDLIMRIPDEKV